MRLVEFQSVRWQDRAHFFAVCARLMRRILIDFARSHDSLKRGGSERKLTLEEGLIVSPDVPAELMDLEQALTKLAQDDPRKSSVVELRFFGGLTVKETAEVLKVSPDTVMRDWSMARAWLLREMDEGNAMQPERWSRLEQLYHAAMERDGRPESSLSGELVRGRSMLFVAKWNR